MVKRRTTRVSDDNGITRKGWTVMDGLNLNPEDWSSLSTQSHGGMGRGRGRPKKNPDDDLKPWLYGYKPSTPDDWARETRERRAAAARVEAQKSARK